MFSGKLQPNNEKKRGLVQKSRIILKFSENGLRLSGFAPKIAILHGIVKRRSPLNTIQTVFYHFF
jgi:hypothetical protein